MEKKMFSVDLHYRLNHNCSERIPFRYIVLASDERCALEMVLGSEIFRRTIEKERNSIDQTPDYMVYYKVTDEGDGINNSHDLISVTYDYRFVEMWRGNSNTNLCKRWQPRYRKGGGD